MSTNAHIVDQRYFMFDRIDCVKARRHFMMSVMKSMNLISVHFLDVEVVLNLSKAALLTNLL